MHVLQSLVFTVNLPIILEVDNQGDVHLANNWSIGSCTRHIDVRQYFPWELKEEGTLVVQWIPSNQNESDLFTKNLGGTFFEIFTQVYVGEDEYTPASE